MFSIDRRRTFIAALAVAATALAGSLPAAADPPAGPLSEPGWRLVAHMSDQGGMFDGNGELQPDYEYGEFVGSPLPSTPDFQRPFPVTAAEILFITGDGQVWGIADYAELRGLIDAPAGGFATNITFEVGEAGQPIGARDGNVLSRPGQAEDPWISIDGGHFDGIDRQRIVWGENDWNVSGFTHTALKNTHGGINVYVRAAGVATSKDDCKRGGWRDVTDGDLNQFKNQGDCVSYVATVGGNRASG